MNHKEEMMQRYESNLLALDEISKMIKNVSEDVDRVRMNLERFKTILESI